MFLINGLYKCCEPEDVAEALRQEGLSTDIIENCNSWTVQHGPEPNVGYFLMTYADFSEMVNPDLSTTNMDFEAVLNRPNVSLVIKGLNGTTETYEYLTMTNAVNVLGKFESAGSIVLIKLEDVRYWMAKIGCEGKAYNYMCARDRTPGSGDYKDYFQLSTLNSAVPWTVNQIIADLITDFKTLADSDFDDITYETQTTYTDILYDIQFKHESILDALMKICQVYRLHMTVKKDGVIRFAHAKGTFPAAITPNTQINLTDNSSLITLPLTLQVHCKNQEYELFSNEDSGTRPPSVHIYLFPAGSNGITATFPGQWYITVPYLKECFPVSNTSDLEDTCDVIALHYYNILDNAAKTSIIHGFISVHDDIGFGLDKVVYVVKGGSIFTLCHSYRPELHKLNYHNPEFENLDPGNPTIIHARTKTGGISARSGTSMGSGLCDVYVSSATGVLSDSGTDITIYSDIATVVGATAGTYVKAMLNEQGLYVVLTEDCPL